MANTATHKTLSPGEIVAGRYRVEHGIGTGGFGAVFKATQLNLARPVALKVLLPEFARQDAGLSRFRREAELAQRLEHPNTVRLLDFGQTDDGTPFIAFELLVGRGLDEHLRAVKDGMPFERVARIASQVLKSLMEAHERGIVHRDIKPSNIFLCDFPGEPDYVKVLDFGIAKAFQTEGQPTVALTQAGFAVGTPNYMAPEQVAGQPVTPAADLYSLGLVMSEALSGQQVYSGQSIIQICSAQLSSEPVPHSPRVLRARLGPVIHRATQKSPERRYASAAEMLEHLDTIVRSNASLPPSAPAAYGATAVAPPAAISAPSPPIAPTPYPGYGPPHPGYGPPHPGYGPPPPLQMPAPPPAYPVQPGPPPAFAPTAPAAAPPSGMNPVVIVVSVLLGILILGFGACASLVCIGVAADEVTGGTSGSARVSVACESGTGRTVKCTVRHKEGRRSANTCWDVRDRCKNGVEVLGHACQLVTAGATVTRTLTSSELPSTPAFCDKRASLRVENVRITN